MVPEGLVGVEDGVFFVNIGGGSGADGGGGDPEGAIGPSLEEGGEIGGDGFGGGFEIELEIADAFGGTGVAKGAETGEVGGRLRAQPVDVLEGGGPKPGEALVAGPGFVGDAGVDLGDLGARALEFAEAVGPEFGFEVDVEKGLEGAEDAADDEG